MQTHSRPHDGKATGLRYATIQATHTSSYRTPTSGSVPVRPRPHVVRAPVAEPPASDSDGSSLSVLLESMRRHREAERFAPTSPADPISDGTTDSSKSGASGKGRSAAAAGTPRQTRVSPFDPISDSSNGSSSRDTPGVDRQRVRAGVPVAAAAAAAAEPDTLSDGSDEDLSRLIAADLAAKRRRVLFAPDTDTGDTAGSLPPYQQPIAPDSDGKREEEEEEDPDFPTAASRRRQRPPSPSMVARTVDDYSPGETVVMVRPQQHGPPQMTMTDPDVPMVDADVAAAAAASAEVDDDDDEIVVSTRASTYRREVPLGASDTVRTAYEAGWSDWISPKQPRSSAAAAAAAATKSRRQSATADDDATTATSATAADPPPRKPRRPTGKHMKEAAAATAAAEEARRMLPAPPKLAADEELAALWNGNAARKCLIAYAYYQKAPHRPPCPDPDMTWAQFTHKMVTVQYAGEEWRQLHVLFMTATRAAVYLGQSVYTTPETAWSEDRSGVRPPIDDPYKLCRGLRMESVIGLIYTTLCGSAPRIEPVPTTVHPRETWFAATPDGCIRDPATRVIIRLLEFKAPFSRDAALTIPPDYMAQVQLAMWVMDATECDFVSMYAHDNTLDSEIAVHRVQRSDEYIRAAIPVLQAACHSVLSDTAPPPRGSFCPPHVTSDVICHVRDVIRTVPGAARAFAIAKRLAARDTAVINASRSASQPR